MSDDTIDGRHARRERSRLAIVDAVFALVHDGKVPPTAEQVAERAGVSVSSIFRTFDGLSDLQRETFEEFQARYDHLLDVDIDDAAGRGDRIAVLVRSRVAFFGAAGALMQIARQRALDYEPMSEAVARSRMKLAEQARRCLGPELERLTPSAASNLLALTDASTSAEAFELMGAAHGRTQRQIATTWARAVEALVDEWCGDTEEQP